MCLAHGHNTVALVRLKPAAPRPRVKHSSTEPLCSLIKSLILFMRFGKCFFSEISDQERDRIHRTLLSTSDYVEASVFDKAKQHACDRLEDVWLRFLKEDLKNFLE